jgi:hypothetical protein
LCPDPKSVAALLEYTKLVGWRRGGAEPDSNNLDRADPEGVFLIVRLLFEPSDGKELKAQQEYESALYAVLPGDPVPSVGPLHPFLTQDGIPFLVGGGMGLLQMSGPPPNPAWAVKWAKKYGRLRARPLRPADDPLRAADAVRGAGKEKYPAFLRAKSDVRVQAWRAVRHLVGDLQPARRYGRLVYDIDKEWDVLKKKAAELRIRWDEHKQEYVAGASDRRKLRE